MKIALITIFLVISPSFTYADEISNKNLGQGVGGFLGILSTQMMQIDNPYALATGGLLGIFIGGQVGENMDNTYDLHKIETARCKEFVTGNNKKGMACRENGEWVVYNMEN